MSYPLSFFSFRISTFLRLVLILALGLFLLLCCSPFHPSLLFFRLLLSLLLFPFKTIWFCPVPSKIQAFLWNLLGVVCLQSMFLSLLTPTSPFCPTVVLFASLLRNPWTTYLFIAPSPGAFGVVIVSLIDLSCVFPQKAFDLISLWRSLPPPQISTKFWVFCLHALIWAIWKERNRRVFDNTTGDLFSVWESFLFLVASWSKSSCYLSFYSFDSFFCNLRSILLTHKDDLNFFINEFRFFGDQKIKQQFNVS